MKNSKKKISLALTTLMLAGVVVTPASARSLPQAAELDCGRWFCPGAWGYGFCINTLPIWNFPNFTLPELPETEAPDAELPDTETPDAELPDTETPDAELPDTETPDAELPDTETPDAELPEVEIPDIETPDTTLPGVDTPETPETEIPEVESGSVSAMERQVVELVNQERAANGLSPLTISTELCDGARMKSQDMRDNNYFSHTSPTYGTPFEMMQMLGISYSAAGENIAMGYSSAQAVVNGWMNSASHRANILSEKYTHIGVGYVADGGYWTQWFTR